MAWATATQSAGSRCGRAPGAGSHRIWGSDSKVGEPRLAGAGSEPRARPSSSPARPSPGLIGSPAPPNRRTDPRAGRDSQAGPERPSLTDVPGAAKSSWPMAQEVRAQDTPQGCVLRPALSSPCSGQAPEAVTEGQQSGTQAGTQDLHQVFPI